MSSRPFDNCADASSFTSFPLFGELPVEIRLNIWRHLIPAQRIISLVIESTCPDQTADGTAPLAITGAYKSRNELGNVVSGAPYRIRVDPYSRDILNLLLGVNYEARRVVLSHYHVHIPTKGPLSPRVAIRPETDMVHITLACWNRKKSSLEADGVGTEVNLLPDFLSDARAYDTNGEGILHIAFGKELGFSSVQLPMDPTGLSTQATEAMRKSLLSFISVTVVVISNYQFRQTFSSLNSSEGRYKRSLPLWASTVNLQRPLASDSRGGETHEEEHPLVYNLGNISVANDPIAMFTFWRHMEKAFGVSQAVTSKKQMAVASRPCPIIATAAGVDFHLRSCVDMERYVAAEEVEWDRLFAPKGDATQFSARWSAEKPDFTAAKARSLTRAAGFWIVPAATLQLPLAGGLFRVPMGSNHGRDQRGKEPSLALFDMS
ncbi:uncharacterized protein PgNI_09230 [Pyricularia grisea]|uniref:2EXR domain-containing protein n=1 Tax=Pyricularia grisea TaxID=148305 RepID=A0A6P8ATK5_PYRGI|nr:uncharacterized protein PgNI_09230 [Pyricularia grisea]TLD05443.1 hypothetical protein PgNI_09230 [Pyricularia grisea]